MRPRSTWFLSTPPSRVATLSDVGPVNISHVSIHATLAGGDAGEALGLPPEKLFLSTPPSRVATPLRREQAHDLDVSIHATLAGGDDPPQYLGGLHALVSIHATLAGGDRN